MLSLFVIIPNLGVGYLFYLLDFVFVIWYYFSIMGPLGESPGATFGTPYHFWFWIPASLKSWVRDAKTLGEDRSPRCLSNATCCTSLRMYATRAWSNQCRTKHWSAPQKNKMRATMKMFRERQTLQSPQQMCWNDEQWRAKVPSWREPTQHKGWWWMDVHGRLEWGWRLCPSSCRGWWTPSNRQHMAELAVEYFWAHSMSKGKPIWHGDQWVMLGVRKDTSPPLGLGNASPWGDHWLPWGETSYCG